MTNSVPPRNLRRAWWAGALSPVFLLTLLLAGSARFWPDIPLFGSLARMAESVAPHLAGLGLGLGLLLIKLGRHWLGGLGLLVVIGGTAAAGLDHRHHSAPTHPDAPAVLRVLWFNMLHTNSTPPAELIAALEASSADVIVIAEAMPLIDHLDQLAEIFPTVQGCSTRRCSILALARAPDMPMTFHPMEQARPERLLTAQLTLPDGSPLTLMAVHMIKPWFYGFTEPDMWHLIEAMRKTTGPLLLVGDFNAAPWSQRLDQITGLCGMRLTRPLRPTWPSRAGALGVPIDQALTRGGARLQRISSWGAELGSNHRGLLMDLTLSDPQAPTAAPASCHPIF